MFTQIITHTPVWVWILLAALVALGWSQTRDRTVSLKRVTILPLIMIAFSASNVLQNASGHPGLLFAWAIACLTLAAAVMQIPLSHKTRYHAESGMLTVAGSWVPMTLILTIFVGKYVLAIFTAMQPEIGSSTGFMTISALVFGALSGIFLGRAARLWKYVANVKTPQALQAI